MKKTCTEECIFKEDDKLHDEFGCLAKLVDDVSEFDLRIGLRTPVAPPAKHSALMVDEPPCIDLTFSDEEMDEFEPYVSGSDTEIDEEHATIIEIRLPTSTTK
jgi:hypothetical protein